VIELARLSNKNIPELYNKIEKVKILRTKNKYAISLKGE